ncbi:ergosterol biosynthesis protein [Oleoguttula sp. CCFEE 5521]
MSTSDWIPPLSGGLLPYWLLLTSAISLANSIQAYTTLARTREVYAGPAPSTYKAPSNPLTLMFTAIPNPNSPVTPLSARTFGTWTALAAVIRFYCAYSLNDPRFYQLALWTYGVAWMHFVSEWWVFGSVRWGRGGASSITVATVTLGWMFSVWGSYVD